MQATQGKACDRTGEDFGVGERRAVVRSAGAWDTGVSWLPAGPALTFASLASMGIDATARGHKVEAHRSNQSYLGRGEITYFAINKLLS